MLQKILKLWENYSEDIIGAGGKIGASILVVVIGIILSRLIQRLVKRSAVSKLHVNENVSSVLRRFLRYAIFIICVIMILSILGVNTASLIALLGAAGVAVGLALKDTLGNIAAGIILLLLGSYQKGEFIEFGSFMGTVKDVNLFNTILETPDGIYISAPNSSIWGAPLKNYTRNGKRRMELAIRISFSDSLDTAFQVMKEIIGGESSFLTDPAPQVILQSVQDSSVNIVIRAWASVENYWDVYWRQMRIIKVKVEEAGLHVPFPQTDVHVVRG